MSSPRTHRAHATHRGGWMEEISAVPSFSDTDLWRTVAQMGIKVDPAQHHEHVKYTVDPTTGLLSSPDAAAAPDSDRFKPRMRSAPSRRAEPPPPDASLAADPHAMRRASSGKATTTLPSITTPRGLASVYAPPPLAAHNGIPQVPPRKRLSFGALASFFGGRPKVRGACEP
jgi:hypothetical protein